MMTAVPKTGTLEPCFCALPRAPRALGGMSVCRSSLLALTDLPSTMPALPRPTHPLGNSGTIGGEGVPTPPHRQRLSPVPHRTPDEEIKRRAAMTVA